MSLIFFEGMDQYVPVPAPISPAVAASAVVAAANLTTTPTDPSPMFMDSTKATFVRIAGEDRVWRIPGRPTANAKGTYQYYMDAYTTANNTIAAVGNGLMLDALQPVSVCNSITVGFKLKHAVQAAVATVPLLLAAFSSESTFTTYTGGFGVVMDINNKVYIRAIAPGSYGTGVYATGVFPTGTFVDTTDGFIGVSNFVTGVAAATGITPSIELLAPNTVEIQYTALGKISVWINNQFVGTATFAAPASYTAVRYMKLNCLGQQNFGNGGNYYYFTGVTDIYVLNGLGTKNTTRLGKVKVVSRLPQTDSSVQFVRPDTSNSNASVVSQSPVLISPALIGSKTGDTDLYGSSAFNFTNEAIIATAITTVGYKTDPSGNDIAPVLNVAGTNYVGNSNTLPVSTTLMKSEQCIYEINPSTGLPFTKAELDATTFGVTVVAPATT